VSPASSEKNLERRDDPEEDGEAGGDPKDAGRGATGMKNARACRPGSQGASEREEEKKAGTEECGGPRECGEEDESRRSQRRSSIPFPRVGEEREAEGGEQARADQSAWRVESLRKKRSEEKENGSRERHDANLSKNVKDTPRCGGNPQESGAGALGARSRAAREAFGSAEEHHEERESEPREMISRITREELRGARVKLARSVLRCPLVKGSRPEKTPSFRVLRGSEDVLLRVRGKLPARRVVGKRRTPNAHTTLALDPDLLPTGAVVVVGIVPHEKVEAFQGVGCEARMQFPSHPHGRESAFSRGEGDVVSRGGDWERPSVHFEPKSLENLAGFRSEVSLALFGRDALVEVGIDAGELDLGGKLREIEEVLDLDLARADLEAGIVVDGDVAHGVSARKTRQRSRQGEGEESWRAG
jgi:hypothetical protein